MSHKNLRATTPWKLKIYSGVAARVENRLIDPITRKPRYGLRSKLVNTLLETWLASQPDDFSAPPLEEEELDALVEQSTKVAQIGESS